MNPKDLTKHARAICTKHTQRAVIIIAIDEEDITWQGWAITGGEQKVTEALSTIAATAVLDVLKASDPANKGRTKAKQLKRKIKNPVA